MTLKVDDSKCVMMSNVFTDLKFRCGSLRCTFTPSNHGP